MCFTRLQLLHLKRRTENRGSMLWMVEATIILFMAFSKYRQFEAVVRVPFIRAEYPNNLRLAFRKCLPNLLEVVEGQRERQMAKVRLKFAFGI